MSDVELLVDQIQYVLDSEPLEDALSALTCVVGQRFAKEIPLGTPPIALEAAIEIFNKQVREHYAQKRGKRH